MVALAAGVNLSSLIAASPAVGIITARGAFRLDNASISGNATLFEGNRIETTTASSELRLDNGARAQLGADSQGVVYRDHLILERGSGRFENYSAEALSLRIQPEGGHTTAEVSVRKASQAGPGMVLVAAINGPVRVTNKSGVVLANLEAGRRLDFTPENPQTADGPTSVTGCLEGGAGKFRLTDEATLVSFEVVGAGLKSEIGHRVRIDGSVGSANNSAVRLRTTTIARLSKKCAAVTKAAAGATTDGRSGSGPAGSSGAGTSGASAPVAVASSIATKAVIAGVIVAGAATGAAFAVVSGEDAPAISPSTR